MGTIDFRAKQQELLNTQQQLRDTKAELDDKTSQLENARLENENKKSELIEQLLSEIDALKENAKNYEQQIEAINAELNTLRTNFSSINQNLQQTTVDQTTSQQTVDEHTTSQQTVDNQITSQQTVDNQITSQQTVDNQITSQQTVDDQITSQQTVDDQTTSQQTIDNQTTTQQTTVDQTTNVASNTDTVETAEQIDIRTYDWFLLALNKLLEEIKNTKKWISKRWLSKAWKRTMEDAKNKLKQYEDLLKDKKKWLLKQKNSEIYDEDVTNLRNIRQQFNNIRKDIGMGQWWLFSSSASFLYNSPENARESNKHQAEDLRFNQQFQEELKNWAILRIFNWSTEKANDFYRKIAQGQYHEAEYQLFLANASILTPSFQKCGIAIPTNPRWWRIERTPWTTRTSADYRNLDRWEAFKQWWLAWILDKALSNCNNLTPWQRETWKNIAVLWGYAAWIYWLFKFFTSDQKRWKKAWITAAVIFWTQTLTWENPFSLFQKAMTWWLSWDDLSSRFWNAFWDAVDWVQNSWIESWTELSWAMYSLMVFNETATVWEIRWRSTKFKNDPQSWTQFCQTAKEKIWAKHFEKFSAVFSENFDENKWNERLNSIWIHDGIDNNKLIYEIASYKTMNTIIINKFLSDNWVKVTDEKTKKEEFEQYKKSCNDNNQTIDINTLEAHKKDWSWFKEDLEATYTDRPEDKQNIKALEDQVEALSLDSQKKSELKIAVKRFYDERTIETKPKLTDFSLKIENNYLILSSRKWQKAEINVDTRELKWFGNWDIRFSNLAELLNIADISNKILLTQKWKAPKDLPAFEYKIGKGWRWIYFNDADTLSFNFDTRVLSWGWWWKMGEIKTLWDNPNEYATYLSKRWLEQNKINIDATQYPILKQLSDSWIIFINEQEVKQAEIRLNKVKELRSMANKWTQGYKPFSIEWNKLVFSTSDTKNATKLYFPDQFPENFSGKTQDLSNFPTILNNKEQFLDFVNNYNNGMRWSKLNQ